MMLKGLLAKLDRELPLTNLMNSSSSLEEKVWKMYQKHKNSDFRRIF